MIDGTHVRADGVDSVVERKPSVRPPVLLAIVTFLILGFVVISLPLPDDPTVVQPDSDSPLRRPADIRDSEFGIGEVVTGFPDALVAIAEDSNGEVMHFLWPSGRPIVTRDTAGEGDVLFDTSGVFMAATSPLSDRSGSVLSAGRFNSLQPVAEQTMSVVWHDESAGRLGYVIDGGERWELWQVVPGFGSTRVVEDLAPDTDLVAWGDWGFALQNADEVRLLTSNGDLKATYSGVAHASRGDGWLFVVGESVDLLSAGGGVLRLDMAPDRVGRVDAASFSPDGEQIAVVGERGILVIPARGDGETKEFATTDALMVRWSSDSRFLIVSRATGLSIFDLETVNQYSVLDDHQIRSVGTIGMSSS